MITIKQSFITASTLLFAAYSAFGTAVQFTAEIDQIIVNGDPQNHADRTANGLDAFGFFVSSANYDAFIGNDIWAGSETSISIQDSANIFAYLNSVGYGDASAIAKPPLAIFPVFSGELDAGGAGFHPVMVVTGKVGGTDYLGVVTSSGVTADFGSLPVGFATGTSWDSTLIGTSGSLALASVVPEPSTYAALAGLLALGFVMVRRRK